MLPLLLTHAAPELEVAVGSNPTAGLLPRVVVVLSLLVLLWIATRWLAHRAGRSISFGGRGSSLLEVLESRRLGPKASIHLVRVGGRSFLLGRTEQGLRALSSGGLDDGEIERSLSAQPLPLLPADRNGV